MAPLAFIFTIFLSLEVSGGTIRPVVSLWPNWVPVYNGDSLTLICNVPLLAEGNQWFRWYQNNNELGNLKQNLSIPSMHWNDRGNYQCQTDTSDKSDALRLDLSYDQIVLQAPPTVRQGDMLFLRCRGWNGYKEKSAVFYKDGVVIDLPANKSVLNAGKADRNTAGNYKCSKVPDYSSPKYSKEEFIYIEEGPARSVLSLSPVWSTILTGDSVTLTCSLAPTVSENGRIAQRRRYSWYKDGSWIEGDQQSITIHSAKLKESGSYQCQAGASERSYPVRLDVSSSKLILQGPTEIYEGDSLTLRCHSRFGGSKKEITLYKDNKFLLTSFKDESIDLGRVDMNASGIYRCAQATNSDERSISVTELFSPPQIKVSPDQVTEGDHMTITCGTKLRPHRETTEL
uniref:Ig-like domain-containing protein n=1 Tax=Xenopus tropicalis TaxID=8364 RepID=A0A803K643_XENTR